MVIKIIQNKIRKIISKIFKCDSIVFLIKLSVFVESLLNNKTIINGIINTKQKINVTSKVFMIFKDKLKLLKCTTEIADKKSVKFLKLITGIIIPKQNDFSGVKLSREEKIGIEWFFLIFSFGCAKFQNPKDRNKVPRVIYKIGKKIFEFSCMVFVLENPIYIQFNYVNLCLT